MTFPITISCPSCQAQLRIQDPSAVGKRMRCPRCDHAMIVPAAADPLAETASQEFGDDPFGSPAAPRSSRTAGGRSRSKQPAPPSWQKPVLIGAAILGLCLLVGVLFMAFNGKKQHVPAADGNVVDMTWLPPETDILGYFEFQPLLQHRIVADLKTSQPEFQEAMDTGNQKLEEGLGISVDDVSSVTLGSLGKPPAGKGGRDVSIFVVRLSKDADESRYAASGDAETLTHNGTTYYKTNAGRCMFFADKRTVVGADVEAALLEAIDRGPVSSRREKFDFMAGGHTGFVAYAPDDTTVLRNSTGLTPDDIVNSQQLKMLPQLREPLRELADVGMNNLSAVGASLDLPGGNFEVGVHAWCSDSGAASRATVAGKNLVKELQTLYENFKPFLQAQGGINELTDPIVASLTVSQTDRSMVLAVTIPEDIDKKAQALKGAGGGPGLPFPGNPFGTGNPFERLNPFSGPREAAKRAVDRNNLKQIGLALHFHHETFKSMPNRFDPDNEDKTYQARFTADGKPKLSWRVHILPFIKEQNLYNEFHLDEDWDSPHNIKLLPKMPKVYSSPLADGLAPGQTTYLVPIGPGGMFEGHHGRRLAEITDGTSNTAMVVNAPVDQAVNWTEPEEFGFDPADPAAIVEDLFGDREACHVLIGDGSVHSLKNTIDATTLLHLLQCNDGHPVRLE